MEAAPYRCVGSGFHARLRYLSFNKKAAKLLKAFAAEKYSNKTIQLFQYIKINAVL